MGDIFLPYLMGKGVRMLEYESGRALEHKSRRQIFNFISTNPGASISAIKRFLGMNESTLKYHLHYLEKNEKIYATNQGRQTCYFCKHRSISGIYKEPKKQTALSNLTRTQIQLIDLIKSRPGITQKELVNLSKLNKKSVSYNLKRLGEQKFVWVVKKDGKLGYEYITREKLRSEMLNELVNKLLLDEIDEEKFNKIKKKLETMDLDELIR
jgi:predicted transcriptional regulator